MVLAIVEPVHLGAMWRAQGPCVNKARRQILPWRTTVTDDARAAGSSPQGAAVGLASIRGSGLSSAIRLDAADTRPWRQFAVILRS
jgi:hypothetical protein